MMKKILFLLALLLCPLSAHADTAKESAYDRIMRTGTIRCGYLVWPPAIIRDPNTGALAGIMVDFMQDLAKSLQLKLEWSVEMNLTTYLQDMNAGKFDLECSGGWPNALRGKLAEYSKPIFYFPLYAAVRADDMRFDNNYAAINSPDVRVVTWEAETSALVRERRFPNSQELALPSTTSPSETMLSVITKKADVTIQDMAAIANFNTSNPGQLRRVAGPPLRIIPNNISMPAGEFRLQQMINTATDELLADGVVDRILSKYETVPGTYLRVAPPYQSP